MTDTLIAKLEKLTGPSREVDAEIWDAAGLTEAQERHCRNWCRMDLTRRHYLLAWAPDVTRSIDAALTLPSDGMWPTILDRAMTMLERLPVERQTRDQLARCICIAFFKACEGP